MARYRASCPASTCATGRTPFPAGRRTGSSATAWCTASRSRTARPRWYRNRYVHTTLLAAGGGLTAKGAPGNAAGLSNVSIVHHGGQAAHARRGRLPVRVARDRPFDRRRVRLRRPAAGQHDRAPEDRSRHRHDALLRLQLLRAVPRVPRGRSRRRARVEPARRGEGLHDDPRLRDHRSRRDLLGDAGVCST